MSITQGSTCPLTCHEVYDQGTLQVCFFPFPQISNTVTSSQLV